MVVGERHLLMSRLTLPGWFGTLRQWHWISSALCLVAMLMFAITGITLNHAGQIEAQPRVTTLESQVPEDLLDLISGEIGNEGALPEPLAVWLAGELATALPRRPAQWDDYELYLSFPRPGGDAWLSIDRETGEVLYERTDRGWIAFFNDLHKGRDTGVAWSWFIDLFAVACVIFCVTGLILLKRHAVSRPTTWPVVGLGLVLPWVLILLFIH